MTKTLRVTGLDPVSGGVETVDLLKQKLVVEMAKSTERSKVSTTRRPISTSSRPSGRYARRTFPAPLSPSDGLAAVRRLSGNLFIDHRGKLELVVVAVLVAAFMLATGVGNFDETLNDQRRGAMYGSLAGTAGALLGFTLAALAILVTLPSRERIESLREHPKWPRAPSAYFRAARAQPAVGLAKEARRDHEDPRPTNPR